MAMNGGHIVKVAKSARPRHALLAAFSEKRLDDGGAVGGEDAGSDFHMMVEVRVGQDFEAGADPATFGIVGAIDEPRDTSLDDGARAHAAGLDGDVERGISKAVVAKKAGGFAKGDDFCMRRGIAVANGAIVSARKNFAVFHEQCTDRDFVCVGRGARFSER